MILNNLTILTCTYNNNMLTTLMIKSLFKNAKRDFPVVIMDNGNKEVCTKDMKEVFSVIDNTNFKLTPDYGQVSKNHCASIEYALKNCIKTKYVLLCDNDILFKPEIKKFFDELDKLDDFDTIGEIVCDSTPPVRLLPYFNLINLEKFKKENIQYFNEDDMKCRKVGNRLDCVRNDTGTTFLNNIKDKWNIQTIKLNNYLVHLRGASYNPFMSITEWLNKNRNLL